MNKYDVVFYEAFAEEARAIQKFLPSSIKALYIKNSLQESGHKLPPATLISTRTQSQIPLNWGPQLKAILSRSTGYDHLTAYRLGSQTKAQLAYLPLYCKRAVAEQALLMLLSLYRKLPQQSSQFSTFHRDGITGKEILGKTMVIVGVGNIGFELYKMSQSLGMNVYGVDIVKRHKEVCYKTFSSLLSKADIIVSAMNLTEKNQGYFSYEKLLKCKKAPIFINISRGELSPLGQLLKLLKKGKLSGVGLDVYPEEKILGAALRNNKKPKTKALQALFELQKRQDVILTPHNAFNTEEAVERKAQQSARQVSAFLKTKNFLWNVPD